MIMEEEIINLKRRVAELEMRMPAMSEEELLRIIQKQMKALELCGGLQY